MITIRRRTHPLAVVILTAILVAACSGSDGGNDVASADEAAGSAERGATAGGGAGAPSADAIDGEPLVIATVPVPHVEGEVEMAVTEATVRGEIIRVAVRFTASLPDGSEEIDDEVTLGEVMWGEGMAPAMDPELIDPVGLKAHEAVAGNLRGGESGIALVDGAPHTLVFHFAAPDPDTETVDLVVDSRVPALGDIPVRRP